MEAEVGGSRSVEVEAGSVEVEAGRGFSMYVEAGRCCSAEVKLGRDCSVEAAAVTEAMVPNFIYLILTFKKIYKL